MPLVLPSPEFLDFRQAETGTPWGYSYKLLGDDSTVYGLDVQADEGDIKTDDARLTMEYPFAASHGQDRIGDFLHVDGIETPKHEGNPLAFTDHGKKLWLPLGMDQDPQGKAYTVEIAPDRGMAFAKTFVSDIARENIQIYEMYKRGVLRSGSIGYRPIEWNEIPPNRAEGLPKGRDLKRVELLETSAVFLPCNQDCSRRMFNEPWDGKSLSDKLRSQAEQWRPNGKPFVDPRELRAGLANIEEPLLTVQVWERKNLPTAKTKGIKNMGAMSTPGTPAMSATDQSGGGALVPPNRGRAMEETHEVPTNPQHMANTHAILSAALEHLDKGKDIVDHPAIQKEYGKVREGVEKHRNNLNELWKSTYPQYEALHEDGKSADEVVEGEEGEDELITDTDREPPVPAKKPDTAAEVEEEPGETDEPPDKEKPTGEGKSWKAPVRKRIGQTKGFANASGAGGPSSFMNTSCMKGCKDIGDHLMQASEAEDLPDEHRKACHHYGMKTAELMDDFQQPTNQNAGSKNPGYGPGKDKLLGHLEDVHNHLMGASKAKEVPPEWQMKHYHYAMKAKEVARDLPDQPEDEDAPEKTPSAVDDASLDQEGKSLAPEEERFILFKLNKMDESLQNSEKKLAAVTRAS